MKQTIDNHDSNTLTALGGRDRPRPRSTRRGRCPLVYRVAPVAAVLPLTLAGPHDQVLASG